VLFLKNKLTFFLLAFLTLSGFVDSLSVGDNVSRSPAALNFAKSCRKSILDFLENNKGYNLPTYSVGTLTFKKHKQKFIQVFIKKDPKQKLKSLKKLNEFRGSSKELNSAYVSLLNDLRKKRYISLYNLRKIVSHSKKNSVPLRLTQNGVIIIDAKAKKKLLGATDLLEKALLSKEYDEIKLNKYQLWFADISQEEVMILKKHFSHNHDEMKALRRYLSFSRTLSKNDKLLALEHADEVYSESANRPWMKKYKSDRKKLDKFKLKHRKRFLSKYNNPDEEILKKADNHANDLAKLYEKLYYGCKNTNSTKVQLDASKTYGRYILTLAPITAGTSYTVVNWDREKDAMWFKGIAYDIAIATFLNFYAGKLLTGAGDSHFAKLVKSMSFYGGVDLITSPVYNGIFSPSEEERKAKLKELVTDVEQREKLNEFLNYIIEKDIDPEFEQKLLELFTNGEKNKIALSDLKNLKEEDFFSPEGSEVFLQLFSEKLYDDVKGDYISTGNQGIDRFWFHRVWDVTSFPLDIYANMLIFDKLCATVNPKKAKIEAALLFLAWRGINDAGYYFSRGKAVNQ
jgi:hypothetical protein